jgi:alcohol dehydrogenase (cytochrome c)
VIVANTPGTLAVKQFLLDQSEVGLTELTAEPLALRNAILVASSGGDHGVRSWLASLDPKTGNVLWKTYSVPAPGEPGSETWKDKNNAWQISSIPLATAPASTPR